MSRRLVTAGGTAAVVIMCLATVGAQEARVPGAVYDVDRPNEKPGPAPRRDIAGIWEPARGPGDAIQANGARAMPADGNHPLPFTDAGRAAYLSHKPAFGENMVPSALSNDPVPNCDPQGFPRIVLHNFRTSQIVQTPDQVLVLYQFNKKWRAIWNDGREMPKDPEPRWWGTSVGKWVDDFTFVAQTAGVDDRTWLDNAGRPHSDAMRVVETYYRRDADHLEMTIVIDDPKFYTKPWTALDKLSLRKQPKGFVLQEMECSPSETAAYNKRLGDPGSKGGK